MPHTGSGIYWEEHGDGPRTLVMLPGFGATAELMTGIVRHLSGFRVLVFDLPGHGRSVRAPADGRLPALAATLHDAINDAINDAGVGAYDLAGCSLGGAIALRLALDHPDEVRALVGIVPWNAAGTTAEDEVMAGFDAVYGDAEALAQGVAAISVDPSKTSRLAGSMLTVTERMWHGWLAGGALTSQADELPGLRVPTCYIVGGKDVVVDQAKQLDDIRRIPGGRAVLLSDLGHLCGLERPGIVADEITAFLDSVPAAGA
ncbi:alpha/beta fold hydrolase [Actinomadura montaniterrae]|uniref:Alpha/beta hydrolase n=1 Tax=Actinomadura montaniterrae TaxID=1803903 RepID=A0A6L3VRK2_9ACTN|nr:alpha/beta hydrolase [Actinomadura montaniterrae]KAB2379471.1 alpha/beta hydrolase [Actinomadura montaniterrae]